MKIETLNPAIGQPLDGKVGCAHQLLAALPKETVGTARPTTDNITISVPFPSADKNLSALLSNLIKLLNLPEDVLAGVGLKPAPTAETNANDLIKIMESLFYKGEEPLSFLKKFIENSGLLYEAKIAKGDIKGLEGDLKGTLLKLIERSEKAGAGFKPAITVNALIDDIEAKQFLNVKNNEEGGFHLQIPVSFPEGVSTADIHVSRDGKGKGEYVADSHRIGFSIELRDAGLVSIDALVQRNNVSIRLQAEKADFLEFMKSQIPKLTKRLSGYGMNCL